MNSTIHGNWQDVLSELTKVQDQKPADFLDRVITANSQAAQAEIFGSATPQEMTPASLIQTAATGGTIVRAFWWGFHIEISRADLVKIVNSPDPVHVVLRAIGGKYPSSVAPFIALAASFIAGALKPLQALDQGRGAYIA